MKLLQPRRLATDRAAPAVIASGGNKITVVTGERGVGSKESLGKWLSFSKNRRPRPTSRRVRSVFVIK